MQLQFGTYPFFAAVKTPRFGLQCQICRKGHDGLTATPRGATSIGVRANAG
jgi:hypothetical protein